MSVIEKVTQTIINTLATDLSDFIADKHGIDANKLSETILEYLGTNSTPVRPTPPTTPVKKKAKIAIKPASTGAKTCQFKITRGKKADQICGTIIRGDGNYCSKHKNRKSAK